MKKHWHKALFDFEQSLLVNSITQLLSDFSACKFIKHNEKKNLAIWKILTLANQILNNFFFFDIFKTL